MKVVLKETSAAVVTADVSFGKKRDRKEDLHFKRHTVHGFRVSSGVKINDSFEHRLTKK